MCLTMIERERRYLVDRLPDDLAVGSAIVQGYLMTRPASVRVRRRDDTHTVTIKTGSGRTRTEIERAIDADEFDALWNVATKLRISKRRVLVPLDDGHTAELDLFEGALTGRRMVEVEFDTDEAADGFTPPDWFGREVTEDRRFTNASLARNGWPTDEPPLVGSSGSV